MTNTRAVKKVAKLKALETRRSRATEGLETPNDHPLVRRLLRRYARTRGTAQKKRGRAASSSASPQC